MKGLLLQAHAHTDMRCAHAWEIAGRSCYRWERKRWTSMCANLLASFWHDSMKAWARQDQSRILVPSPKIDTQTTIRRARPPKAWIATTWVQLRLPWKSKLHIKDYLQPPLELVSFFGFPYESGSTNKGTAMETIGRHHEKLLKLPTLACENLSRDFTNSTGAP